MQARIASARRTSASGRSRGDLGDRRRDRVAARPFELDLGQRPEDVRVLVEEATHLGDRARQVAHRRAGRPSAHPR